MQQISLNSPDLKIPVDAVADYILRASASGIIALIGIDSDQLRVLLDHTEVAAGHRRALFLSFDRLQNAACSHTGFDTSVVRFNVNRCPVFSTTKNN